MGRFEAGEKRPCYRQDRTGGQLTHRHDRDTNKQGPGQEARSEGHEMKLDTGGRPDRCSVEGLSLPDRKLRWRAWDETRLAQERPCLHT